MARCPRCGREVKRVVKEYDLSHDIHVKVYECCVEFNEWTIKESEPLKQ